MGDEQGRHLDAAHELLRELESPSAYELLGAVRETPATEVQSLFMQAMVKSSETGRTSQVLLRARQQLMNENLRLELDTRFVDQDAWHRELENLRNRFAMVDFLKVYRT